MVMTKRKEFDQVNDDFSDFSLSSPATKIRRLDAELAPIMEEEESSHSNIDFQQSTYSFQSVSAAAADELTPPPPPSLENQERAIVLFNNHPITNININNLHPSPQFSLTSHILSGLKNGNHIWSKHSLLQSSEEHQQHVNNNSSSSNQCLAVVPWVESRLPQNALVIEQITQDNDYDDDNNNNNPEMMEEADENDVANMDIEDNGGYAGNGIEQTPFSGIQDFHQCQQQQQQQHCMVTSQFQNSTATTTTTPSIPPPVVWFQT